jgi:putative tryptophan/tyrosine transport system permease protein
MPLVDLLVSALGQGTIYAPMALGVFIAFRVLNTPDLTIDGSFVFGMTACATVAIAGHPVLALLAGVAAGMLAGLATGLLQTKLRINAILSGILTMTGLYTVNYAVLGGQSNLYLQSMKANASGDLAPAASPTVYRMLRFSEDGELSALILSAVITALCAVLLAVFFKTRLGIAVRATGDNEEMVRSSSINADFTRIVGIVVANGLVGLSGAMLCQRQRYADLGNGSGMLVVGLASVIIGQALFGKRGVTAGLLSAVLGSEIYRLILQAAYRIDMPSYAVKLLSALIVAVALALPLAKEKTANWRRKRAAARSGERSGEDSGEGEAAE